ncbi:MAG: L-fucose:H+ symporter permease [Verrucomicrobia bacterium]|nr:MAG: L-fucose:H+ symporter permease [Verrucomicrobiota bacterium]
MGSLTGMAVASGVILANLQISTYRAEVQAYHDGLTEPHVVAAVQDLSKSADGVQAALKDNQTARARELAARLDAVVGDFENRVNVDPALLGFLRAEDARRKADGRKGLREIDYEETLALSLAAFKEGKFDSFHGASFDQMQRHDLDIVKKPYVGIGLVVIAVLVIFIFSKMPDTGHDKADKSLHLKETLRMLWHNKRYIEGVVAQTFYVGAQIMCWTFIIHYGTANLGITASTAQNYNIVAMVIFCTSRFICTFLLKYFSPGKLLMVLAFGGVLTSLGTIFLPGYAGLYSLIGISACMSLMFPTIYGIALEGMGEEAKIASAGLIFAIVGGALMPPLQGRIIDLGGESGKLLGLPAVSASFVLPMLCFVIIAVYGWRTMREHAERRRLAAAAA